MDKYQNRQDAGLALARALKAYQHQTGVIVLALPRGGVPVAFEIAKVLRVPLDVFIVRKLGVPGNLELAMGAIASGGGIVFNEEIVRITGVSQHEIDVVIDKEQRELQRREAVYRGDQPPLSLKDKTVILVDDGIATGASMRAAILGLKTLSPKKIIVAVPVADREICAEMATLADEIICPLMPASLRAVGIWYEDFSQTEDDEVRSLLAQAKEFPPTIQ